MQFGSLFWPPRWIWAICLTSLHLICLISKVQIIIVMPPKGIHRQLGFPGDSYAKESVCNAGDLGSIPGLGRSPRAKGMGTHSSILVWRIPWTEEPGRLCSIGSQRIGHEWVTFTFTKDTGYRPWGRKELDTTEWLGIGLKSPHSIIIVAATSRSQFKKKWRWRRNRTGRPLSLLQIHRKNNWTLNKFHKTTSDR